MSTNLGSNLIFLISQPRSGSTMVQKILGAHGPIHTVSEPWVALHPLYALKSGGIHAEYDADLARSALDSFMAELPDGRDTYVEKLRQMLGGLYDSLLAQTDAELFLDKTPRYYLIIDELAEVFPDAKFIFLARNPLSVFCSQIERQSESFPLTLHRVRGDLFRAPKLIAEASRTLGARALLLNYESAVYSPEAEIARVCDHLGIVFDSGALEYQREQSEKWSFGDEERVYEYSRPNPLVAEKWRQAVQNPQVWRLTRDYLETLDADVLQTLRYRKSELSSALDAYRPGGRKLAATVALDDLIAPRPVDATLWTRRAKELVFHAHNKQFLALITKVRKKLANHF